MTVPSRVIGARPQSGYVLLFVMAALVVLTLVAARFALRLDLLREQGGLMQDQADADARVEDASAQALYWLSTRPIGVAALGFVDEQPLRMDGRVYRLPEGVLLRVQDERGLLSLNAPDRDLFLPVLVASGASLEQADRMIDILLDYVDTDNLRRLNGAEAADYAALGLPPPRNDWILSVAELARMPVWRDLPELREKLLPYLGVRRDKLFNPNTAPLALLRLIWPRVPNEQWDLFETLRSRAPFASAEAAQASTGIPFQGESLLFHASNAMRLQLWAPGLPQAREYNLLIRPTGNRAPWLIHEVTQLPRSVFTDAKTPVENFPVSNSAPLESAASSVAPP
ncbi:general secretion pathway protein GspK [Paucibacter sp. DJ1R-11]|uniref:general secretion pathway protein GspK n=1 Tax=Paucibacter sp. DJ1R-11 TaxID=2893556 RepID=UPI0021E50EF7|nr:general secretion pathway protein GspK [Paucibacter sp. DJ1R-11]MCV2364683.1 general secretion pathway protein GspK [Paucibacter sp. DJ1R-11]